jgi:large subunit ribosomal protein L23
MSESSTVIRSLLRTEKGSLQSAENKYLFAVLRSSNKIQIRKAVESMYKVKVSSVNTQVVAGKNKRVRYQVGKTPDWKKAVVTLKQGHKIDLV